MRSASATTMYNSFRATKSHSKWVYLATATAATCANHPKSLYFCLMFEEHSTYTTENPLDLILRKTGKKIYSPTPFRYQKNFLTFIQSGLKQTGVVKTLITTYRVAESLNATATSLSDRRPLPSNSRGPNLGASNEKKKNATTHNKRFSLSLFRYSFCGQLSSPWPSERH